MTAPFTLDAARALDAKDPLAAFRAQFEFPTDAHGKPLVYLVGNSLGLMPRAVRTVVNRELDAWGALGVEGHFERTHAKAPTEPWFSYHDLFRDTGARLVGAEPGEVVAMGSLTTNLHLLMVSFYRPTAQRGRIVIEKGAFPSDRYAVASQARFHGLDPKSTVHELAPRPGEHLLRTEDVVAFIEREGDSVALFLMSGVNYYTGQAFDIRAITKAARAKGIVVGWDLAHAAGNLALNLHDDDVDFAAWCTYKYLNSGPGAVGMAFVHARHARDFELPRFWGWWGNDPKTRFLMGPTYEPQEGAAGWQISNAPVLSMAALHASLQLFDQATMPALVGKREALSAFMHQGIGELLRKKPGVFTVLTPADPAARGAQVSLQLARDPERMLALLQERGVAADFRRPDVIRVAGAPLYCSFEDAWRFVQILDDAL